MFIPRLISLRVLFTANFLGIKPAICLVEIEIN